jgi:branched-chain amino acid transport system ATP-binding protein
MSVLENVMVGRHVKTNFFSMGVFSSLFRITTYNNCENEQKKICIRILEKVGLLEKKDLISSNLSYGDQRRLEIARALACEPKILALDEPAAGMNPTEKIKLKKLIKELLIEKVTIIIIEHDVKLMSDLCDHIYVMDRGKIISSGKPTDIKNDKKVIKAYLGSTSK